MPRNVRNFWIEARADGAASPSSCRPRNADGGIDATIYQRCDGAVTAALRINGWHDNDDTLVLDVGPAAGWPEGMTVHHLEGGAIRIVTKR